MSAVANRDPLAFAPRADPLLLKLLVPPAVLLGALASAAAQPQPAAPQATLDRDAWLLPFPKQPADTFVRDGVRKGSLVGRDECESGAARDRGRVVFVEAMGRAACVRYHLSADAFPDKTAAVYLPGDKGGFRVVWRNGQYELTPEELIARPNQPAKESADLARRIGDPDRNQNFARAMASRLRTPAILLSRPGTDGSSGWVALRRTRWEVEIVDRALDAIKARHGIEKLHLVGQSGGGHLVGALSSRRNDVACAVAGSAPLSFDPRSYYLSDKLPEPQRFFNPAEHAAAIAAKKGLRLMLVTDGRDSRVFVDGQAQFVRALARSGGRAPQFFVSAGDALSHGVTAYSLAALRSCIEGKPEDEIGVELARMNAQALENRLKATREREAREKQTRESAKPEPSAGPSEPAALAPDRL